MASKFSNPQLKANAWLLRTVFLCVFSYVFVFNRLFNQGYSNVHPTSTPTPTPTPTRSFSRHRRFSLDPVRHITESRVAIFMAAQCHRHRCNPLQHDDVRASPPYLICQVRKTGQVPIQFDEVFDASNPDVLVTENGSTNLKILGKYWVKLAHRSRLKLASLSDLIDYKEVKLFSVKSSSEDDWEIGRLGGHGGEM